MAEISATSALLSADAAVLAGQGSHGFNAQGSLVSRAASFGTNRTLYIEGALASGAGQFGTRISGQGALGAGEAYFGTRSFITGSGSLVSDVVAVQRVNPIHGEMLSQPAIIGGAGKYIRTATGALAASPAVVAFSYQVSRSLDPDPIVATVQCSGALRYNFKRPTNYPAILFITPQLKGGLTPAVGVRPIIITPELTVNFAQGYALRGAAQGIVLLTQVFDVSTFLRGTIEIGTSLTGVLRYVTVSQLDVDYRTEVFGHRPSTVPVSIADNVESVAELKVGVSWTVPINGTFFVSTSYTPTLGDGLFENGALPGYVGMRLYVDGTPTLRFRAPRINETLYSLTENKTLRWNGSKWETFKTTPERIVFDQHSINQFDELKIVEYYSKVVGSLMAQFQYDTSRIRDLADPNKCPDEFLSFLAHSLGAEIEAELDPVSKRETVRNFIPLQKLKGVDRSITLALRSMGFKGYACQVWEAPLAAHAFKELPPNAEMLVPVEGTTDYFPTSKVSIHINFADGSPMFVWRNDIIQRVAEYLTRNVLPACSGIRYFASDIPAGNDVAHVADTLTITSV